MNGHESRNVGATNAPPLDPERGAGRARHAASAAWMRLLAALLLPLVAFVLQSLFWPTLQPYVWILFYPAVFFSSWVGGLPGGPARQRIHVRRASVHLLVEEETDIDRIHEYTPTPAREQRQSHPWCWVASDATGRDGSVLRGPSGEWRGRQRRRIPPALL